MILTELSPIFDIMMLHINDLIDTVSTSNEVIRSLLQQRLSPLVVFYVIADNSACCFEVEPINKQIYV